MKRIGKRFVTVALSAVALVMGALPAFADEARYKELLAQGKEYEAKGQVVHALGAYWDAMEADETRSGIEAYEAFATLEQAIKKGNPGVGDFDDFSLYDGWVEVCKEYEIYWNEHITEIYTLGVTYQKGALDMKSRTATYDFYIGCVTTPKFERLRVIANNCPKYSDWEDIPKDWPKVSIFKDSSVIPTVSYVTDYSKLNEKGGARGIIISSNMAQRGTMVEFGEKDFDEKAPDRKVAIVPAWTVMTRALLETGTNGLGKKVNYIDSESAFKVQFHVEDENGRTIVAMKNPEFLELIMEYYGWERESGFASVSSRSENKKCMISLSGISSSDIKLMDEGKVRIIVDSFTLNPNSAEITYISTYINNPKITGELPAFDLAPKNPVWNEYASRFKYEHKLSEVYFSKLSGLFWTESNTPNDVMKEIAVLACARNSTLKSKFSESGSYIIDSFKNGYDSNGERVFLQRYGSKERAHLAEQQAAEEKAKAEAKAEAEAKAAAEKAEAEAKAAAERLAANKEIIAQYADNLATYKKTLQARTEVPQRVFEAIMGYNNSNRKADDYAADHISFYEIMVFCNRMSIAMGLKPVYTIKKSTNPDDWGTIPSSEDKDWSKYKLDKKADGFRLSDFWTKPEAVGGTRGAVGSTEILEEYDGIQRATTDAEYFERSGIITVDASGNIGKITNALLSQRRSGTSFRIMRNK